MVLLTFSNNYNLPLPKPTLLKSQNAPVFLPTYANKKPLCRDPSLAPSSQGAEPRAAPSHTDPVTTALMLQPHLGPRPQLHGGHHDSLHTSSGPSQRRSLPTASVALQVLCLLFQPRGEACLGLARKKKNNTQKKRSKKSSTTSCFFFHF